MESVCGDSDELVSDDEERNFPKHPVYKKPIRPRELPILKLGMKFIDAAEFREEVSDTNYKMSYIRRGVG